MSDPVEIMFTIGELGGCCLLSFVAGVVMALPTFSDTDEDE